jgi:large subunit ribosomal protein L6
MSRIAKVPVELPQGVEFSLSGNTASVKGSKGTLSMELNSEVEVVQEENTLSLKSRSGSRFAIAVTGTTRALLANMVQGVTEGFEKKLELRGVGYRAAAQGNKLNLTLGFSHPVVFNLTDGVAGGTPRQTQGGVK